MNKDIKFRSQIGGFNKDDVISYIKEADVKYSTEIERLSSEVSRLTAELEKEKKEADGAISALAISREESETCKAEAEKLKLKAAELSALVSEQDRKIAELVEAAVERENTVKELSTQLSELKNQGTVGNSDDKNSPAYKLAMYDKISSGLGDLMINANRNADEIIARAKEESERLRAQTFEECEQKNRECNATVARIKSETEEEASYIRERLSNTASSLLTTVSGELHVNIENCVKEIDTWISEMQYEIKLMLQKIHTRSNDMNDRINYYQSCVSDGIQTRLTEMDEKYGIKKQPRNGDNA